MVDLDYVKLQKAFEQFMSLLQDDIRLHLDGTSEISDKTTPFISKVTIDIGVRKEDDERMKLYQPRLEKLLSSLPAQVTSSKPILNNVSDIPLDPSMKTPEENK